MPLDWLKILTERILYRRTKISLAVRFANTKSLAIWRRVRPRSFSRGASLLVGRARSNCGRRILGSKNQCRPSMVARSHEVEDGFRVLRAFLHRGSGRSRRSEEHERGREGRGSLAQRKISRLSVCSERDGSIRYENTCRFGHCLKATLRPRYRTLMTRTKNSTRGPPGIPLLRLLATNFAARCLLIRQTKITAFRPEWTFVFAFVLTRRAYLAHLPGWLTARVCMKTRSSFLWVYQVTVFFHTNVIISDLVNRFIKYICVLNLGDPSNSHVSSSPLSSMCFYFVRICVVAFTFFFVEKFI